MRQYTSADKYLYSCQIVAGFEERFIIILSMSIGVSGIGLMKLVGVDPGCRHTFCFHLSIG